MVWFAGAYVLERRRRRAERHAAVAATSAPPVRHPVLGLGGRSIELSLGQGLPADPNAFELAVDELHERITAGDAPPDEFRAAGDWLIGLANLVDMPVAARETLRADLAALRR